MKVGVYSAGFSPDAGGGYTFEQEILGSLMRLMPESRHEFTVFLIDPSAEVSNSMKNCVGPYMPLVEVSPKPKINFAGKIKKILKRPTDQKNALQVAAENINIQMMWFPGPLYMSVDIPYIATVWDLQHRLQPWFPEVGVGSEWSAREANYSLMLRRASYVIAGTQAGKDEIRSFYQMPERRIRILPHPSRSFALKSDGVVIDTVLKKHDLERGFLFYPAQFWPHKNHVNLLLALKALKEKYGIGMTLALAGSEKGNQNYVREYAKQLGLDNQVRFLGFVPTDELIALYKGAFALVYLTYFGPENLPPLEAFSLGCPVIASSVSGAQEQLGDAAILVNPSEPESIALAIKNLVEQPAIRSELVEMGRKRASKWTGTEFVRDMFSIFDEFEPIRRVWRF